MTLGQGYTRSVVAAIADGCDQICVFQRNWGPEASGAVNSARPIVANGRLRRHSAASSAMGSMSTPVHPYSRSSA